MNGVSITKDQLSDDIAAQELLKVVPRVMRSIRAELWSLSKGDLTVPQFRILFHLKEMPRNNRQLADLQGVSVAAMSRMVDGLVKRSLIRRIVSTEDRRQVHLELTKVGHEKLSRIQGAMRRTFSEKLSGIDAQLKISLLSGLSALEELFR
ncbi:MarR family transcriptional regulator [bacterium]|nr:MarR family transcriptional regulator [bacterium]